MYKSKREETPRAKDKMAQKAPSKSATTSQLAEIGTPISYKYNKYL